MTLLIVLTTLAIVVVLIAYLFGERDIDTALDDAKRAHGGHRPAERTWDISRDTERYVSLRNRAASDVALLRMHAREGDTE